MKKMKNEKKKKMVWKKYKNYKKLKIILKIIYSMKSPTGPSIFEKESFNPIALSTFEENCWQLAEREL